MYAKGEARQTNRMCNGNSRWICSCGDHIQMNFMACWGGVPQGTICCLRHTSDCDKCILRGRSAKVISPCKQCKHVAVPDSPSKSLAPPDFSSISPHWTEVLAGRVIKFGGQGDRETFLAFLTDLVQTWASEETLVHPCWSWAKQQVSDLPLQNSGVHKGFYPDSPKSLATPAH